MKPPRIFINYRTADTASVASALSRDLERELGKAAVFIDHGRIEGGEHWPQRLENEIEMATALLCLIGERWLQDERLKDPEDWVRREICRALERGILVLPILVEGASLPKAEDLPEQLAELVELQARPLRRLEWEGDRARILRDLGYYGKPNRSSAKPPPQRSVGGLRFSLWPQGIRPYLKDLVERMQERDATLSAGDRGSYVDLAAEQREDPSPRQTEYPRRRGHLITFPKIQPVVAEVAAVASPLGSAGSNANVSGLQTRTIRSVLGVLRSQPEPIVLLGEPGSGKSTTLRELAIQLARRALRVPGAPIPIYVELGKFRGRIDHDPNRAILELIHDAVPAGATGLRRLLRSGDLTRPIVVLFDAMDEMPRFGDYTERAAALAAFAENYALMVRSVFACRTNDFDPSFGHRQLVLRPFNERRIRRFLSLTLGRRFEVEGQSESPRSAARRLLRADELGAEAGNPLTLSLASGFLEQHHRWPRGRISLFEDHLVALADRALQRRGEAVSEARLRDTIDAWSDLAYQIFHRDGAVFMQRRELEERIGDKAVTLAVGGGLVVAADEDGDLLKIRHHRLQEFLVARRLRLPDPPRPDWSAVLVSPRWQETLLSYFAIGGHSETAFTVVLDTLRPAQTYFARLRPILERVRQRLGAAQKAYDAIQPDEYINAGEYSSETYSPAQRARKNAAKARRDHWQKRLDRLNKLPPERETAWGDHVSLAARLSARLEPTANEVETLRTTLRDALTGLLDFGRPAAQVRMLSAWREIADWCPVSLLDPARDSKLDWVRAQAIHALITTELHHDRVDESFVEELEWETLSLRLPSKLAMFWETASLRAGRRSKLLMALTVHTLYTLLVLVIMAGTAMAVVPRATETLYGVIAIAPPVRWLSWFALIGLTSVLTVPVLRWRLLPRLAMTNAMVGGIALGSIRISQSYAPEGTWARSVDLLAAIGWTVAPTLVTSATLLFLLGLCHLMFRLSRDRPPRPVGTRQIEDAEGISSAWKMGLLGGIIPLIAGSLVAFIISPAGGVAMAIGVAAVLIPFGVLILSGVLGVVKERWQAQTQQPVPIRIIRMLGEAVAIAAAIGLVIGLASGVAALIRGLMGLLGSVLPAGLGSLLGTAALAVPVLLISLMIGGFVYIVVKYVHGAFGLTLAELRYRLLRQRLRRRPFDGDLAQWKTAFEGASEPRRRELLESFDHRAMGLAPAEALAALYALEDQVEPDQPAADLFHKTMHTLREAERQQRWADPAGS